MQQQAHQQEPTTATQTVCISHPKSGRTWLRMMLNDLSIPVEFRHLGTGASASEWGKHVDELDPPTVEALRVIFLHRDPRDTLVSFFYEMTCRQIPKKSPAEIERLSALGLYPPTSMLEFAKSPRFGIEKICRFNLSCLSDLDAYTLSYEALLQDPVTQMKNLLSYLGQQRDDSVIFQVVEANRFERMRKLEESGEIPPDMKDRLGPVNPSDENSYKVRKGKAGVWREELDEQTQAYVNRVVDELRYFEFF